MKKTKEFNWGFKMLTALSSLVLVLLLGVLAEPFSMVSYAQSQGKIVVESAKIRKEASTSSEVLGSAARDNSVTINNQVTGSDGKIWYQVFVDADTLGYIRSDLVQITDGTTPPTGTTDNPTSNPNANENMPEVTAVEPLSANVTGSQSVRVRSNASTAGQIVTVAQNGMELTVIGMTNGNDGKVWYQVKFTSDGTEMTGFIRSDYIALSGDPVPVTEGTTTAPEEVTPPETEQSEEPPVETPVETKDWDTQYDEGKWYLVNNVTPGRYNIDDIFQTVKDNQAAIEAEQAKVKSQKMGIIILIFLAIAMAGVIAYLIFKIKDMKDAAYIAEVERETVRRRTADRPTGSDKKVMHTVGADKKTAGARPAGMPAQGGQRPVGAKPAGTPAQGGQRPAGAKPAGTPAQGGQRPTGARPAGASVQEGQRPTGARPTGATVQEGQRPTGPRPTGASVQEGQKTIGAPTRGTQKTVEAKPAGEVKNQGKAERPAATPKSQQNNNAQNPGWKSKNFMTDEDEFEFEFLNWDGEDE